MVEVCEVFKSLQGEGLTVGLPAFFIRLSGCSLKCRYCDTPQAFLPGKLTEIGELVEEVRKSGFSTVVITGGEPVEQENLPELIASLSKIRSVKRIILETSGILWRELPQEKLTVVLSPKPPTMKDEFPLEGVFRFLETFKDVQLKVGVLTEEDLNFAISVFKKARKYRVKEFVIQPIDIGKDYEKTSKSVVEMVLKRQEVLELNVRVIPQIHKFLGMK